MDTIKNLLIITFHFAPSGEVGAKRFTFLSDMLHARTNHFNVHVITIKENYLLRKDNSLRASGIVHRTLVFPPPSLNGNSILKRAFVHIWNRYLCLIDPNSGWIIPAFIKGLTILRENKIHAIVVSGPPFSPLVPALLLSIIGRVRLIIDYRDPWTTHPWNVADYYRNVLFKTFSGIVEKLAVKQASALVFCSEFMKAEAHKKLRQYTSASFFCVNNGFKRINELTPLFINQNKKVILYAGSFYGERKICMITEAIHQLIGDGVIKKRDLSIDIFGKLKDDDRKAVAQHDLSDMIKEHQPVEHYTMLRYMKGADILLLPSGSNVMYAIPYKFYDYLSVKTPILALAPEDSAVASLMREIDCGELGLINSNISIRNALEKMLVGNYDYTFSGCDKYTWENAAEKYGRIIEQFVGPKRL